MRRLTITIPGDRAEAVRFTSGVVAGFWEKPQRLNAWRDLDALRKQHPEAEIGWIDEDTPQ